MKTLWLDVVYAARLLRKSPGYALVVILTLGLGIGGNTTVFSFANAFLINPVALPNLDRLVMVLETKPGRSVLDWSLVARANLADWQRQSTAFEDITGYRLTEANSSGDSEPEQLRAAAVLPNFFEMLSVKPLIGRTFAPDEGQPGNDQVAVLSYAIWQRNFGANPNLVGQNIRLNGKPYSVAGVMNKEFAFPISAQVWLPLTTDPKEASIRSIHSIAVVARLKPGASVARTGAEMTTIAQRLEKAYPTTNKGWGVLVQPVREFVSGYYTKRLRSVSLWARAGPGWSLSF